jgi:hypothetical protein
LKARLPTDQNENAGGQRKDPHQDSGKDDAKQDPDADQDQINRKQEHSDVFGEVHIVDLAIVGT